MVWKIARPPLWAAFRAVSRLYLGMRSREYRYIFILGHMRSGSSLLAHLLASHPDIVGAGETHTRYNSVGDLPKLIVKTSEMLRKPILRETYIVDQINHPYVAGEVLLSDRVSKCIILIREPESTLRSMMQLSIWTEKQALEYYVDRLQTLVRYGSLVKERSILVEYDDLVGRSAETLAALTDFLGLDRPLTPHYETHRMTGRVPGHGDSSDNIKAGQIVRARSHEIAISADALSEATRVFRNCRSELQAVNSQARNALSPPKLESSH